jgi:hypothetical protein
MLTIRIAAGVALLVPACTLAQSSALEEAAATITQEDYARRIAVIAHDSMGGRDTPSEGLEKTAAWIASEFAGMGLRGGAEEGSFIQRYPLRSIVIDAAGSRMTVGTVTLRYGEDILPLRGSGGSGEVSGGLVLVSGSTGPDAALADEVRGQHVVVVTGERRRGLDRTVFGLVIGLANAGASSVSVTSSEDDRAWSAAVARALEPDVSTDWGDGVSAADPAFRPLLQIRTASLERLLAGRGIDLAELRARFADTVRAHHVPGLRVTLTQRVAEEPITGPNVVAILDGSDPELRNEFVVFSGHMDHVGIGVPDERGDSIFNGADDDASGTVAVIEVAEAMAALPTPPRRSMIFLLVSGEEKGLWGSEWYAEHPSAPVDRLVANLNADMVGRNWADTIVAIGKEHSDLGETLEQVNAAHPELGMTAIDDLWPEERFYFRSDHYNFARRGVPILFFFNGTHDDYHGLDDEPDRIDAEKAARIARLVFYLGVDIGNRTGRPEWNPESYAEIVSGRS